MPRIFGDSALDALESKERVALVVEDDDAAAELIRLLLVAEGFTVMRAADGEIPKLATVPVVIIAGIAESNLALARGAAGVLQKPISRGQLKFSLARASMPPSSTSGRSWSSTTTRRPWR